jgi:hypothetical protein
MFLHTCGLVWILALVSIAAGIARAAGPISFSTPLSYTQTGASGVTAADS